MTTSLIAVAGIFVLGVVGMFVLSLTSKRPDNLGVEAGRLAEAPDSPNCVSTQTADRSHWIAPISFESNSVTAMESLVEIISGLPGSTVIERDRNYLYAEFRSSVFRFVDDVEFLIEPESNRIHFRSASRVGHSDLGANRRRMEHIRTLFAAADKPDPRPSTPAAAAEPALTE